MNDIIDTFDAVMVARGDLGVELPLEQVPVIQKKVIKEQSNLVNQLFLQLRF